MTTNSDQALLSAALRGNAAFSLFSGLLFLLAPATLGGWLGISADLLLRVFGVGFIGHAVLLMWADSQSDKRPLTLLNIAAIAPYPLIMIGLVATGVIDRTLGQGLALADGAIVGLLALAQWRGLPEAAKATQAQVA